MRSETKNKTGSKEERREETIMSSFKRSVLMAVAGGAMGLSSQALAFVPWSNPAGSAVSFDWAGGGSDFGLFGSPVVAGDTFIFSPTMFRADSANGVAGQAHDRMQVDITAHQASNITGIRITEFGDYGIFGPSGPGGNEVSATGGLFVTNLDLFAVRSSTLATTPGSPIYSGTGNWTGTAQVGLANETPPWRHVRVVLNNNLIALSINGSVTFIEKKVTGAAVLVEFTPAPSAGMVLGMGGLILTRRRRR